MDDAGDMEEAGRRCEGAAVKWISPWVSCLDSRVSYGIAECMLGCGPAFLHTTTVTKPSPFLSGPPSNNHQKGLHFQSRMQAGTSRVIFGDRNDYSRDYKSRNTRNVWLQRVSDGILVTRSI